MKRILPILIISDHRYTIDLKSDRFIPEGAEMPQLAINSFEPRMDEDLLYGYYDLVKKETVEFPETIQALPENVIAVVIPNPKELDPVAWAEMHGLKYDPDYDLPVVDVRYADIIPIEKSELIHHLAENQLDDETISAAFTGKVIDTPTGPKKPGEFSAEEKEKIVEKIEQKLSAEKRRGFKM